MEKIKYIVNKLLTKEAIMYIVFGAVTTIVNIGIFYILTNFLNWDKNLSNFIAITASILTAYWTNKDIVFHANAKTVKDRITQFVRFILGRLFTMVIEMAGGACLFLLPIPIIISKMIITALVIVLNFIISKFFAFK